MMQMKKNLTDLDWIVSMMHQHMHGLRKEGKDEFDAWLLIPEVRQVKAILLL